MQYAAFNAPVQSSPVSDEIGKLINDRNLALGNLFAYCERK
jgi:hypothetical protein